MRIASLLLFVCACGGSRPEAAEPPADPIAPATSEPPAATEPPAPSASAAPEEKTAPKAEASQEWTVEKGSAKGVELTNEAGASLKLKTLGWTSFKRKATPPGGSASSANVWFATVSADDVAVADVECTLPAWADAPSDPLTLAATLVPLVAKDSVPAAAIAKIKPSLLACGGGKPMRLLWHFENDKLVAAKVEGADAKTSACVKTAMAKAFLLGSGICLATVAA